MYHSIKIKAVLAGIIAAVLLPLTAPAVSASSPTQPVRAAESPGAATHPVTSPAERSRDDLKQRCRGRDRHYIVSNFQRSSPGPVPFRCGWQDERLGHWHKGFGYRHVAFTHGYNNWVGRMMAKTVRNPVRIGHPKPERDVYYRHARIGDKRVTWLVVVSTDFCAECGGQWLGVITAYWKRGWL